MEGGDPSLARGLPSGQAPRALTRLQQAALRLLSTYRLHESDDPDYCDQMIEMAVDHAAKLLRRCDELEGRQ